MTIRWLISALKGLKVVRLRISQDNPRVANVVADRIEQSVERLAEFPYSGRNGTREGTRELVVTGLPYLLVYRIVGSEVQILRLFHDKENRQ
jgi:toxin ParE1/3/4